MKAYKIDLSGYTGKVREVVSEAVQKKAFELGCAWKTRGTQVCSLSMPYIFIESSCMILSGSIADLFDEDKNTLITAADFLELTADKVNEPTFKPFGKVLCRDCERDAWRAEKFSHRNGDCFVCVGNSWKMCIPYEGNEHLVGTTDSAK